MRWIFLHESVCMCKWRPLALCLQQLLYFEPCPAPSAETISLYASALFNSLIRWHCASEFRFLNGFLKDHSHAQTCHKYVTTPTAAQTATDRSESIPSLAQINRRLSLNTMHVSHYLHSY
jgi:hypothetical protein